MDRINKIKNFLEQSPGDAFLTHALALEWIKLGKHEEALLCFQQNEQQHPAYVATYYHLGKLQESLSHMDEAMATYEAGIKFAQMANDQHSLRELRAALDDML